MTKWRCTSRKTAVGRCPHICVVECEFEPRGCLFAASWENWVKVRNSKSKKKVRPALKEVTNEEVPEMSQNDS